MEPCQQQNSQFRDTDSETDNVRNKEQEDQEIKPENQDFFLYGRLAEDIFMIVSEKYEETDKTCLLKKALYGPKLAPFKWNKRLTFLKKEDMTQLKSDQCIFRNARSLYLAIHVNDGIIMNKEKMNELLRKMTEKFEMTTSDDSKIYLRMEITRTADENSTKQDVQNAKRTLRYLKGTQKLGIQYFSSESNDVVELKAFCDSDYAGDVKDRKSTTGEDVEVFNVQMLITTNVDNNKM
ncbi:retrovirus-related pol polyprotein from transposon tnt 1-94 [Lasius niger]|uniref:Retrovirus-related pol polyprotein from transposon tnt 1-94 n=1 Tax=Lasius niger TaxID=67767 RepID=A0A0J7KJV9_LASNI|nr:retrovirus-related pol polyprotein from transposon tnt 1-94 [Lasius niger]